MPQRPTSVTVIAILLIVFGTLAFLGLAAFQAVKDDPSVQAALANLPSTNTLDFVVGYIGAGLYVACGTGFLLRQGWMRFLLLLWTLLSLVYENYRGHMTVFSFGRDLVFYGVVFFFLFTAKARGWFGAKAAQKP
ncbi:MAG: hypothetical protein ACM3ZT_03665 [Bacillota bacterium]